MTILNPTYLWGLLALAIPIAIHLWSKKKVRTIKVGSIQFISETKSKQSRSINLNEWWLLLLRCLAIATLVFILAEPRQTIIPEQEEVTYIFEPSLLASIESLARFKTIPHENRRLLVSGFPKWDFKSETPLPVTIPNYWQLAQEMEQLASDSIVVFTNAFASGLKGKRPGTSENIHWVVVDLEEKSSKVIQARQKGDEVELLEVESDGEYLAFAKAKKSSEQLKDQIKGDSLKLETQAGERWILIKKNEPLKLTMVYDDRYASDLVYLEAAFRAIGTFVERDLQITKRQSTDAGDLGEMEYLVWYSDQELDATARTTLKLQPDALAHRLIEQGDRPTLSYLTQSLTIKNTLQNNLADELLEWLDLNRELKKNLFTYDNRKVALEQLETKRIDGNTKKVKVVRVTITHWLWMLLGGLLLVERILARYRKQ